MLRVFAAAFAYALGVFAVGCGLGTARELAVAPVLGPTAALAMELPIMVGASAIVARWLLARFHPPLRFGARLAIGVVGLVALVELEDLLTRALRGGTILEHWSAQTGTEFAITVAGLAGFLLAPLIMNATGARRSAAILRSRGAPGS